MNDVSLLSTFRMFADMPPEELAAIAEVCSTVDFEAGEEIFEQDVRAKYFYGVIEGEVELVLTFTERVMRTSIEYEEAITVHHETLEKPIVVQSVLPGEVFGWSSLVDASGTWTATARCPRPTRVFRIPADRLLQMFELDPKVGYAFMRRLGGIISDRLQHRTEKLIQAWGAAFETHRI